MLEAVIPGLLVSCWRGPEPLTPYPIPYLWLPPSRLHLSSLLHFGACPPPRPLTNVLSTMFLLDPCLALLVRAGIVDVYTLVDRVTLRRSTTITRDSQRVAGAVCTYKLVETPDEAAAVQFCTAVQQERLVTVRG